MTYSPQILIVDDDPAIRASLTFMLELEGFAVRAWGSAEELLAEAMIASVGCLVLDYRLPGLDGLALLAVLRRRGVNLPALIITSNPPRALRERAAAAGVAIIEKPLLGEALTTAVRDAFAMPEMAA